MTGDEFKRKLTAILSADVVGYSRLMGDDEAATVKTLETYKGVMFSLIKQHRGRVVDSPGDNLLAEFGSVVDAVQCAVSIQKELQTRNADLPENRRMEFRIGINLGDVIEEDDRIYGDGVNIAARLEALADPGGICISKTAFDYIENKLPFGYRFIGDQTVKNIAKPIGAYKVLLETRLIDEEEQKAKAHFWRRKAVFSLGIVVILAIVVVLYWNFYPRGPSVEPASIERMAYPLPEKPSIAVLPFTNMSGDPEQEYIGDGLSENIISALSVSSQIFVIARNTTFTYKGKAVDIKQVAEDLGVQYILEGSIQKSGNQLRVSAQFIDALSGHHLWSEVYDREMKNLFDLQDEITKKIVVSLQVELGERGEDFRLYAKSTDNLEAWKHYIKGIELRHKLNPEDNVKAREHFEVALELDPLFVGALRSLALTHLLDFIRRWSDYPLTSMNRAFELAQKAVEMDKQDPGAHSVLGMVFLYQRQYEEAVFEGKLAITLNPNYADGHVNLGIIMLFSESFDESITLIKKAYRLNPNLSPYFLWPLVANYIFLGRYEDALEVCNQMEEKPEKAITLSWLYQELGREEEARAYMAEYLKMRSDSSFVLFKSFLPFKNPAHFERVLDAFRKAGMPNKSQGAVQEKPSIAVLPFDDLSPDKDQEYFVLGLSEEILNSLAQISDLTVKARTSSFSFKGQNKTIQEIASVLGVDHVLEGSVRKAGNTIRINAKLIKAGDESNLWSETYDKEFKVEEMFSLQEDIANNVADKLKLTLEAFQSIGGTKNIEAYELYLNARGKRAEDTLSGYESALELLDAATKIDPEFALAWAFKAHNYILLNIFESNSKNIPKDDAGQKAAERAIKLEPNLSVAYINLGLIKAFRSEWIEAGLNINKALELTGESLSGDDHLIIPYYLYVGKFKQAYKLLEEIRRNDPIHQVIGGWYYFTYGYLGDRQQAEEDFQRRNKFLIKGYSGWHDGVITSVRLGSGEVLSRDEILPTNQINTTLREYLGSPEAGVEELRRIYSKENELSVSDLSFVARWAAYFGDYDLAMDVIEKTASTNTDAIVNLWPPIMREFRQTPRFKEFVREIGLVDYWKEYGWPDLCRPVGDDDFVCD